MVYAKRMWFRGFWVLCISTIALASPAGAQVRAQPQQTTRLEPEQGGSKAKPAARANRRRARITKKPPAPPVERWVLDVHAALFFAFGGNELGGQVTGEGVGPLLGVALTPLWLGPHGFGVGVELGYNYTASMTDQGGVSLSRFPLAATAHAMVSLTPRWYLLFAGGAQWDLDLHYSASYGGWQPDVDHDLGTALGALGEFGVLYVAGRFGVRTRVRYTAMDYVVRERRYPLVPGTTDASHVSLLLSVHYLL